MPIVALHVAAILLAAFLAAFRGRNIWGFIGTTWLIWSGFAFLATNFVNTWLAPFALLAYGPLLTPVIVADLASVQPVVFVPIILVSLAASAFISRALGHRAVNSRLALAVHVAFFAAAWLLAEIATFTLTRASAMETSEGEYCLQARSAISILVDRFDGGIRSSHAVLVDGSTTYTYSFRKLAFIPQFNQDFIQYADENECLSPQSSIWTRGP